MKINLTIAVEVGNANYIMETFTAVKEMAEKFNKSMETEQLQTEAVVSEDGNSIQYETFTGAGHYLITPEKVVFSGCRGSFRGGSAFCAVHLNTESTGILQVFNPEDGDDLFIPVSYRGIQDIETSEPETALQGLIVPVMADIDKKFFEYSTILKKYIDIRDYLYQAVGDYSLYNGETEPDLYGYAPCTVCGELVRYRLAEYTVKPEGVRIRCYKHFKFCAECDTWYSFDEQEKHVGHDTDGFGGYLAECACCHDRYYMPVNAANHGSPCCWTCHQAYDNGHLTECETVRYCQAMNYPVPTFTRYDTDNESELLKLNFE